jgi:hypothetical protein
MEVKNSVIPNKDQMDEFLEGDIDSPISMVNLLKFKEKAEYEDGRDTNLSGKEAYMIYGIEVGRGRRPLGQRCCRKISQQNSHARDDDESRLSRK